MSHHYAGPLAAYNSLTDKHLTGYFNNTRIRRHLQRVGLVTRSGRILSEKEYRMNAMRKDHQKYIRECLAQAIFHKVLDMERHHQIEIKRKLENFARKERVQKIKVDRSKRPEEDGIPLFSPRPPTGPKSSYGRNNLHDGDQSDSSESPSSSRPNTAPGNMQRPVRLEPLPESSGGGIRAVPKTTSATQPKTSALEHDHHFPTGVDKDLLKFISAASDQTTGISPYRLPVINNYVTPVPPPPKKSSRNPNMTRSGTSRGRRFRPTTAPHDLDQLSMKDPVRFHKTVVHSNVAITMLYLGKSVRLSHDDIGYKEEIKVFQQHCGGENLCIYKGSLLEGETFQCTSRRHRGFPFSLTFYINGILVDRLSSCCEYKHRKGARLGGKHGYFRFMNIEGASPCYRCIIAMGLDKKPSPPPKKRKEDPDDEDYEDPKVETMMGKMKSEEQCIEEMQLERSMSATLSAYGADKETSEDKTELEGDAEEEEFISEHNQTKDDDDDENGDQTKDEYDEDFEADEDKPDEEVNEEEVVKEMMNGKSLSNGDHERDDLDLEMEGTNSSKQAQEASDSEKEENDAYSDTEFEHGEKQGKNIVDDEMMAAATKIQTFYRNRKKYLTFQEKKTDSKSIQEKIAEAIENTEILRAEPEPSDSSTDEEDNLMSTAQENNEVHAVQNMAEESVTDDFCLEDALDTEDQLMDNDSQTNQLLMKESSMTEKDEENTMDIVTEKEATAMETMSERIPSELEETKEPVGKQGSKLMSMMEDSNKEIIEEQIINQEMEPTEASMKQEMPTEEGISTDDVESKKEDAVKIEEENSIVDPAPSLDTHNILPRDPFEAAEPVVENDTTEVDIDGNGVVEDITCKEDVEEESKEALEDVSQMVFEVVDNTEVRKENEAAKEELSLSKEVPNTSEKEALEEEGLVNNLQQTEHIASECFEDLENAVISSDDNELIDSNKVGEDNMLVAENTDTKEVEVEEVGLDRNGAETEKGSNEEVLANMETLENVDKEGSSSMFEPADDKVSEDLVSEKDIMTEDFIQEDAELGAELLPSEGGVVCDAPLQKEEGAIEIASDKKKSSLTALEEGDDDKETTTKALDTEDKEACDGNGSAQETSMADVQELAETALQVQDEMIDIQVHENGVEREDVPEGAEQAIHSLCDDEQVCLDISPEKKEPPLDEVLNGGQTTTETIPERVEADAETMNKQEEEERPSEDQETIVEIDSEENEQEPAEDVSAEETNEVAQEEVQINATVTEYSSTGDRTSPEAAINADEVGHEMLPEVEETVTETLTIGIGQQNTTKEASINEEDSPIVEPVIGEDILPNEEDALTEKDTMTKARESPENLKELTAHDEVSVVEGLTPEVVNIVPEAESTEEVAESEEHLKDDEDLTREETPKLGDTSTAVMPDKAIETTVEEELTSGEAASQKEETLTETSEEMALTEEVTTEEVLNEGDKRISIEEVAAKESVSQESAISGGTTNQGHAMDEIVKLAELIAEESSENKIMEKSEDLTVETNEPESEEAEETHVPNGKGPDEGTVEHDDHGKELMSEETAAGTSVGLSFDNEGNTNTVVCNNLDVNPEEMLNQTAETMVNELSPEGEETTKETGYNATDKESGEMTSQTKEEEESSSQGHSNNMQALTGEEVGSGTL
ncbi:glutamate-rich protein 3 [Lissotriton helveticus]